MTSIKRSSTPRAPRSSTLGALSVAVTALAASCGAPSEGAGSEAAAEAEPVPPIADPAPDYPPAVEPETEPLTEAELAEYGMPYELVEGEPLFTVLEPDGIPSIDAPVFVGADEAFEFMHDDETVLGVVGKDGTAKCYSAWQLDSHEIVNDQLDGVAIAATW